MVKAHFVKPPYVIFEASSGQTIVVSADIKNIDGAYTKKVTYMTLWDSEMDYVMSRAEAFVAPGATTNFNCFFEMPENRDLWVDIVAGHYQDEPPGFHDDEVFGAKIENTEEKPPRPPISPIVPLVLFAGINILGIAIIATLIKRRRRKLFY